MVNEENPFFDRCLSREGKRKVAQVRNHLDAIERITSGKGCFLRWYDVRSKAREEERKNPGEAGVVLGLWLSGVMTLLFLCSEGVECFEGKRIPQSAIYLGSMAFASLVVLVGAVFLQVRERLRLLYKYPPQFVRKSHCLEEEKTILRAISENAMLKRAILLAGSREELFVQSDASRVLK